MNNEDFWECNECGKIIYDEESYNNHIQHHKESFHVYKYTTRFMFDKMNLDYIHNERFCVYAIGNNYFELNNHVDTDGLLLTHKSRLDIVNYTWKDLVIHLNMFSRKQYDKEEINKIFNDFICDLLKEKVQKFQIFIDKMEGK